MLRRYVHGANPGVDDPIAWFSSSSFSSTATRHLFANPQGSVVLSGDSAGNALRIFAYDEYGVPTTAGGAAQLTAANGARFGYTGQAWIPELGMYHYKARVYSPTLGRFMQTDPIGYDDQINLYAYVGNDPVNRSDPTGMDGDDIVVTGRRPSFPSIPLPPFIPGTHNDPWAKPLSKRIERGFERIGDFICSYLCAEEAPADAKDPNGAKAPGKPGEAEGFKDPPGGEKWQPGDKGQRGGWVDDKGNVWRPTGQAPGRAHGGAHWDVTDKGGNSTLGNRYPGGRTRAHGN